MSNLIQHEILNILSLTEKDVLLAEYLMLKMPQAEYETKHFFHEGLYTRELHMPAGTFAIGMDHKEENILNILVQGSCTFMDGDGEIKTLKAPCTFISPNWKKKIGFFNEDTIWINVHRTDAANVDDAEDDIFIKSDFSKIEDQIDYIEAVQEIGIPHDEIQKQVTNVDDLIDIDMSLFGVYADASNIHGVGVFTSKAIKSGDAIAPARICGFRTLAGRYTNHSKKHNAIMSYIDSESIHLIAIRDIQSGEEITVDYRQAVELTRRTICQE